ncbi:hypothetical protein GCM10027280_07250 [Micromonospora polyrhachis]|uniref:Uncharacterized protein n=1 Tax=Micromonospora polyrhachis TaxID=1282883 RepID=A0A7W7SKB4_9ACTN|nr:hypothetical protein [Micromonospora polyrhachis]MBB4956363.1 hypothetical protein [Micromonospora polyrhachis]
MPHRDDPDEDETTSSETARPVDAHVADPPGAEPGNPPEVEDDDRYLPL